MRRALSQDRPLPPPHRRDREEGRRQETGSHPRRQRLPHRRIRRSPSSVRGYTADFVFIDEAARIGDEVIDAFAPSSPYTRATGGWPALPRAVAPASGSRRQVRNQGASVHLTCSAVLDGSG